MKKLITFVLTFSLAFGLLAIIGSQGTQAAGKSYIRVAGNDRLGTAIQISKKGWPDGLNNPEKVVILARADNPVDALSAASLAGVKDAPILLTNPGYIDTKVIDEMKRLGAKKVYVLGSEAALSENIVTSLKKENLMIERIAGPTRFETAQQINEKAGTAKNSTAIIANGNTVVDALSATSEAAINGVPIYLTRKERLPLALPTTVKNVMIYGSESVVSKEVENQLIKQGKKVTRLAGPDRFSTNVSALKASKIKFKNTILVRGTSVKPTTEDYPDAVAASGLAKRLQAKIVLTHPTSTSKTVKNYLATDTLPTYVLGSSKTLLDSVLQGLGYDAQVTKEALSRSLLEQGKLPLVGAEMGDSVKDVENKLGDPLSIDYNYFSTPPLLYNYNSLLLHFDSECFADENKHVTYMGVDGDKVAMTEEDFINVLGEPQGTTDEILKDEQNHRMGYVMGAYHFGVVIDIKTKKVRSISLFEPDSYISVDFGLEYRGPGRYNACNKNSN